MLLIGFHVYPGAVARIVPDKYLAAPHGVPRSVAGAAVDHDASGTHGVAHRVLCIAVYGNRTAAQIGAQRIAGDAVDLQPFAAHTGGDEPLALAGTDTAFLPGVAYRFV